MPHHRIAIGSCSHPALPQPLWNLIRARQPAAFVWGGDAVYADRFAGLNWTAVGLHRVHDGASTSGEKSWRLTFPPPSIHLDATPDIIRSWYEEQWRVDDYRRFVEGWYVDNNAKELARPVIFGTIDDHDYGQNNGDITYQYKRESNLAFMDFIYAGCAEESKYCAKDIIGGQSVCEPRQDQSDPSPNEVMEEEQKSNQMHAPRTKSKSKSNDPMYQRAKEGKGVYGVSLFDFSRTKKKGDDSILWGGGHWVPDEDAMIDPDIISRAHDEAPIDKAGDNYSATHSVAIFALDVRSNKTPWPKGNQKHSTTSADNSTHFSSSSISAPLLDFLGQHQWEWFQNALANSHATVNIIVSGLQIHPERFPNDGNVIEEWSKFPEARQMIYDMILNSGVRSPVLVSGDVHMAQFMRKDCVRSTDIMDGSSFQAKPRRRPLVEITTSGMTHSWGTSFSSQPKNHRLPLKLYTYFVSPIFMSVGHYVSPWNEILVRTKADLKRENSIHGSIEDRDNHEETGRGGRTGKQYYLGLNFAEFEFEFDDHDDGDGGAVTVRVFGKQPNVPPKLEMKWTFDQLSGNTETPGTAVQLQDFLDVGRGNSYAAHEWICIPHRGLASIYHECAANVAMFLTFCLLFFLPHGFIVWLVIVVRRRWSQWKSALK